MSATTEHTMGAGTTGAVPQPPHDPGERVRWRTVARGRGMPQPLPLVSVEVDFDRAQSDWLTAACERTGLDYVALVKKLVDDARAGGL